MVLVRLEENYCMKTWKDTDNQLSGLHSIVNLLKISWYDCEKIWPLLNDVIVSYFVSCR